MDMNEGGKGRWSSGLIYTHNYESKVKDIKEKVMAKASALNIWYMLELLGINNWRREYMKDENALITSIPFVYLNMIRSPFPFPPTGPFFVGHIIIYAFPFHLHHFSFFTHLFSPCASQFFIHFSANLFY